MLSLELGQDLLGLGPSRGRQPLPEPVELAPVVEGFLEKFDLDVGQEVLVLLESRLDDGHLAAEQAVALGADAAEIIVEADGVQPADSAVIEQGLDPGEILLGVVGLAGLIVERGRGAGHLGLLVLQDLGLELQQIGRTMGDEPLEGILRSSRRILLLGRLFLQVAFFPVGDRAITILISSSVFSAT